MTRSLLRPATLVAATFGAVIACGSSSDSTFDDGQKNGAGGSNANGQFGDTTSDGGGGSTNPPGVGDVQNVDPTSACATSNSGALLPPISLVFMIDRSGSMARERRTNTRPVRWDPVVSGLSSFFGSASSANISASLSFFPIQTTTPTTDVCQENRDCNNNQECVGGFCTTVVTDCTIADYQSQAVGMTQLPNAAPFTAAFAATGPGGFTPTSPALSGAIEAAKAEKAKLTDPNHAVAVVLATDGAPNECSSTVDAVNGVAAGGFAAGIKTYVIGVGPNTGNLNSFATNGGTGSAIMIPTNDTAQVTNALIAALTQIASSLLGCEYGLPTPPAGQSLDVNAVNVNFTPAGGSLTTLPYSADCANAKGWHYDSTSAPTKVTLCADACSTAQATAGSKLDIVFGCTTAVPPGGVDPGGNIR